MGFKDFTTDDDDSTSGGGGSGLPPLTMGGAAQAGADVTDLMINYNERFKSADPALFRDRLIELTMAILISVNKRNPLLVGSAGVGKTRIVEEIARLIATKDPRVPDRLKGSTLWELPLSAVVAGGGIVGEIEQRVTNIVDFATDPKNDAIVFIDEIHLLQSRDTTYTKIAQILKPALARGDIRLIGATTGQEGRKLDDDPAFARRFSRLVVDELTREQTLEVLKIAAPRFEAHYGHQVLLNDDLLAELVVVADENSRTDAKRPDNALTLLDKSMAHMLVGHSTAVAQANARGDQVTVQMLRTLLPLRMTSNYARDTAVRMLTGMATKATFDEKAVRSALTRLKGQDSIMEDLIEMLRREDLAAFPRTTPITWMFAGPSGVGKTEATKILADALTGQEPIILNMAEYDSQWTSSKLIGSPPGYVGSESDRELPFDTLESNPYRVVLFDEMEKAHRSIHRLLLGALNEGWMRMASGKVVDFSKAIFVFTTNAARDELSKPKLGFGPATQVGTLSAADLAKTLQEHFDAEFLGRCTKLVAFRPLGRAVYAEILEGYYARERERILTDRPRLASVLPATIDPAALDEMVAASYVPEQGARPAERTGRRHIEDLLLAARQQPAQIVAQPLASDEEDEDRPGEGANSNDQDEQLGGQGPAGDDS